MLMMAAIMSTLAMLNSWTGSVIMIPFAMVFMTTYLFSPVMTPITLSPAISLDTMSAMLIILTMWITTLMIIASMKIKYNNTNSPLFLGACLALMIILITSFAVNSLLSFYVMFEASLIPTLVIILTWGYQPERLEAGMYLMLYTVTASLPLLTMLMKTLFHDYSLMYFTQPMLPKINLFMSVALVLAFLVKLPMYLVHLWLPKAHVEAPVAGSMILASVLLKLGGYGLLRLLTLLPQCALMMNLFAIPISIVGATLTSILCMRQTDMKSMIAYSSVSHMAFVIVGIFSMNKWGWEGTLMMMIAHGLISSGLFAAANMYYENTHSRSLLLNSGMELIAPSMTMWWFIMIAGNMAAPPFINLVSEIILITSAVSFSLYTGPMLIVCSFFTVCYSMILFTSLHHGPCKPSTNFINIIPVYYSVMALHSLPPLFLVLMSSELLSWT